jgi:hypothetical protein
MAEGTDRGEPDGMRVRAGGCSCGAVRFIVRGEPHVVGVCHCADCRKATGSAFLFYADWPREAFEATGETRTYQGRSFCPTCGGRLFHLTERGVEIDVGALDDAPGDLRPTREGWIKRREPWLHPVPGTSQHEEDPA